jgi:hypothetical protein
VKYAFPTTYGERCILLPIDSSLVPLISGALKLFEQRGYWIADEDYEAGYNAFAELQALMSNNCLRELVESNRQIYRLLDTALNGVAYSASGDEPPVISPAIPAAPAAPALPPMRDNLEAIRVLLEAQGANEADIEGILNTIALALV